MEDKIAVATIGNEIYKTELVAGTHHILADEPLDVGGKDLGPRPGDFLRMSLASCTAITLRMYANRKKWEVEKIEVKVSGDLQNGRTTFKSDIKIIGSLDDEQKKRMLQIARLCPTHKTLTSPIEIETNLL